MYQCTAFPPAKTNPNSNPNPNQDLLGTRKLRGAPLNLPFTDVDDVLGRVCIRIYYIYTVT